MRTLRKVQTSGMRKLTGERMIKLFSKRQIITFARSANAAAILIPEESSISKREFDEFVNLDSMTEYEFLKYNPKELLNLAKNGTKEQKNWLRNYLKSFKKTTEREQLTAALAN